MVLPTTATLCTLPTRLSDTFLKRSSNSILQKANITGNTRRSKSAVPGWYKKLSTGSNNVSPDAQYRSMSPVARIVTSSKNGSLIKSALKNNDTSIKQYSLIQTNNALRNLSGSSKPKFESRARSMPRWNEAKYLADRGSDQINSEEVKPRFCASLNDVSGGTAENTLPTRDSKSNLLSEGVEEIENTLINGTQMSSDPEVKDASTSFKRTVNINLNELDPVISEDKKTLSMDINVVVSVKSPEKGSDSEIGFQEVPGKESKCKIRTNGQNFNIKPIESEIAGNLKITDRETAENLKFGSEQGIFSQKDITEEIGKVYDFLKQNLGPKSISNNSIKANIVKNYDAVKKLYVNALGCVKACEVLKNNGTGLSANPENEFSDLIDELEGCLLIQDEVAYGPAGKLNTSQDNHKKTFLGGKQLNAMGIRNYSSKSDCEKAKKLPCLQSSELSKGEDKNAAANRSVCERMCMPCCKPARDPPRCFYPYHKQPCKKLKAPRPAFSECKQIFEMKQITPCECVRPRATRCKKSKESETCAKQ